MMGHVAAVAGLWLALSVQQDEFDSFGSTSCPGARADGKVDDALALQACLDAEDNYPLQLKRGGMYFISQSLRPQKTRQIWGGRDSRGVMTTIHCGYSSNKAFNMDEDTEVHGIHVDRCGFGFRTTANLTLVDCTISNMVTFAVEVYGEAGRTSITHGVLMTRSRIVNTSGTGVYASGSWHIVMDHSEITSSKVHGVFIDQVLGSNSRVTVELHNSTIRDSEYTAIMSREQQLAVLLTEGSSLQHTVGPCIAFLSGYFHEVRIEGASRVHDCYSGVLFSGARIGTVVMTDRSSIHDTHSAILMELGENHTVIVNGGSAIRRSSSHAVHVHMGNGHKVEVSGQAVIEDTGGHGVWVEGGMGIHVDILGGAQLDNCGLDCVLLSTQWSHLTLEKVAIRHSAGSAVHIKRAGAGFFGGTCVYVRMEDVYLVHNKYGVYCRRTSMVGLISGTVYLNSADFDNACSSSEKLQQHGPLLEMTGFRALTTTLLWSTFGLAASVATLPWLQILRARHFWSNLTNCFVGLWLAVILWTTFIWANGMVQLWRVTQYLEHADLAEDGVGGLFALAGLAPLCVPAVSLFASRCWLRHSQEAEVGKLLHALEVSLWRGASSDTQLICAWLVDRGLTPVQIQGKVQEFRRKQSQEAGVSVAYLLSPEFLQLARQRTGLENPTFLQMKEPFWSGDDAIGKDVPCPRDGRLGCALVDTLQPRHRQRCTHFLSWVWRYPVLLVREALRIWTEEEGLDPNETFLFMCFFVNNQFRILIENTQAGSDDLETTFEQNLRRIGRLVALLDHWEAPLYLSRVWTIYEQYVAAKLQLPVTVILNQSAGDSLLKELDKGKDGIFRITGTLCNVRAETAEASMKADEDHVKAVISSTTGFDYVNQRVRHSMINWVASVLRRHMDNLVKIAREGDSAPARHRLLRQISCTRLEEAGALAVLELEG